MIRPDRTRRPSHPGEVLKGLYLDERGISVSLFAAAAGISRKHLSAIVNGRSAVSAATALRIGRLLGTSPDVWLRLQAAVDLFDAEQALESQEVPPVRPDLLPGRAA